jgi:Cu2+-exporting ATPase
MICIPIAAGVLAYKMNPMVGAAAMSLSSFTVCMNALRLNLFNIHNTSKDKKIKNNKNERSSVMTKTVKVKGMMCAHCEKRVHDAFTANEKVVSAEVSHDRGDAILTLKNDMTEEEAKKIVENAGYEFVGIE